MRGSADLDGGRFWGTIVQLARLLPALTGLVANLIPLYGILYWEWDTFQLLMLYWTETVIIAFWTLMRLAKLPEHQLGRITVNGRDRPATRRGLVGFFVIHAGTFIFVHLIFLWVLFASSWPRRVLSSGGGILYELFVANGIWLALIMMFVAGWIGYYSRVEIGSGMAATRTSSAPADQTDPATQKPKSDAVGAVVGTLYVRIFIMQIAIIAGGWFAEDKDSLAPLLIVIGFKILFDFGSVWIGPIGKGFKFSSDNVSYKS